ncbi:MAG TPA: hypothetical protein VJZ77_13260 [Blastocatellia bacterium]|nr:hypothetical protein [Blastocatellia bacterium]
MQFIPLIGAVEDQIVECFPNSDAPPYSSHPRFPDALAVESVEGAAPALSTLMESILPMVPGMAEAICMPGNCGLKAGLQTVTQHLSKGINRIRK